jgi:methionyl-tRNA formyltransferase
MRFVIVTQGVSRIVKPVANTLGRDLIGVIESAPRGFRATAVSSKRITALNKFCLKSGKQYFLLHSENKAKASNWLREQRPDLVIVYSMSQLLTEDFLAIPRLGCINLHPSLLPKYRGPNPWFWLYYNQELFGGVTLHFLDPGEDTGDIIAQRSYRIAPGMKSPAMQDLAIGELGLSMILDAIKTVKSKQLLPRRFQPAQSPTPRARNIKPSEHSSIIQWHEWPLDRIWHLMRGTELWLNCIEQPKGLFKGLRWSVGQYVESTIYDAYPHLWGSVILDKQCHHVACRGGYIQISLELHPKVVAKSLAKRICRKLMTSV